MQPFRLAAALAVGLLIGASAVAIGTTPPQTYTGCLGKDGSLLRVAIGQSPAQSCNRNETQVSWNSVGPQGEPGTGGITGLDDLRGTTCNVGTEAEGLLEVTYGAEGVATLRCATTRTVSLTVRVIGTGAGQVEVGDGINPPRVCTTADGECTWAYTSMTATLWGYTDGVDSHFVGFQDGFPYAGTDGTMWFPPFVLTSDLTVVAEFAAN